LRREVFKTAPWACATMETIQLHVFTLGARVHEWTDRMYIRMRDTAFLAGVVDPTLARGFVVERQKNPPEAEG
jgi:hypothetical protein